MAASDRELITMDPETRKLLTIVTEALLEAKLCDELIELGATGYTVVNARGSGNRGVRGADCGRRGRGLTWLPAQQKKCYSWYIDL